MAQIEKRYDCSGFVYTSRTRMGFSPKFTVTRLEADHKSSDLVIWGANGHAEPTRADIGEVIHALANEYPDRRIMADTSNGLVPVFVPDKPKADEGAEPTPIRAAPVPLSRTTG